MSPPENDFQRREGMRALLAPGSIAVLGASPQPNRGHNALRNLLQHGYTGALFPVNPRYDEVLGRRCYPSLAAIGQPVDLVMVTTPSHSVPSLVREAGEAGARSAIVVSAGFEETGAAGRALQQELRRTAEAHGLAVCGPNCLGLATATERAVAMASSPEGLSSLQLGGSTALISQSGGLLICTLELAGHRGLAFRYVVSSGNEAVTTTADYLEQMLEDPLVEVIALISEGLVDGRRFTDLALRAIASGKRLVLLKLGTSEHGRAAAVSHTASLAGEERILDGACRQAGIIRVYSIDELVETTLLLSKLPPPTADGIAAVGVSGGTAVLMCDWAERSGLELPRLPDEVGSALATLMPDYTSPANPLDGTGGLLARPDNFWRCLELLDGVEAFGALVFCLPIKRERGDEAHAGIVERLLQSRERVRTPVAVVSVTSESLGGHWREPALKSPVPLLQDVRSGFQAIGGAFRWWRRRNALAQPRPPGLEELPAPTFSGQAGLLNEFETKRLLAQAGLGISREFLAESVSEAERWASELGYPIALKLQSPDLPHKAAAGVMALGIRDASDLRRTWELLLTQAIQQVPRERIDGVLVQEMVDHEAEYLLGGLADPIFGPVVTFGLGGTGVEQAGRVAFRPLPLQAGDVQELIEDAVRRSESLPDRTELARAIERFGAIYERWYGSFESLEINPLVVRRGTEEVIALDALAVVRSPTLCLHWQG